ncbi:MULTISPECIES: BLUF domain-containing protein [unclassified Rathayibacter]|uniref:BLUF domain-containing protein n=1 Tax=unclassified Rathayibacter TaxID=2609250 RepID=UPI000CE85D59|nr:MULTISPECIES: BLUF domain-containing protein [unclassified Rathayibacter]PPF17518.1 hypothetical protein C5B95_14035 [Rathayibacter sp. AY1A7]PPG41839.1 hypothetical protein C5C30_07120 [Rathayibacter sp. AY2B5]PPG60902.1 hypothetical protein C5C69_08485 [Rathayibacter sp. AY1C7]PPI06787.1 hypothetical protein C5C63_09075 [Rathayibacter sp. AY1B8]PPI15976.1 hypothetical protein C5D04_06655 [Rathayibacter sp. AY1D2]
MKQIQYAGATFQVGDAVADALVSYASGLAAHGRTDSVELPVLGGDGHATVVTLLLNSATSLFVSGAAGLLPGLDEKAVAADLRQRTQWLDAVPAVTAVEPSAPEDLIWLEFPEVAALMDPETGAHSPATLHLVEHSPRRDSLVFTVVYVSTLDRDLGSGEIRRLLETSRRNNVEHGVSGMLVFRGRRVMQLLEGEESDVRSLYARILADPRHEGVVTVWTSVHEQRRFPDWSMGFDELDLPVERPASWPEPDLPEQSIDAVADDYLRRRSEALRSALVSSDPLVASLAVILHGHRPERVLEGGAGVRLRCAECRAFDAHDGYDSYPCATARTAIQALEAA